MTPTSDTIRTRLAFAFEAAETEEDRAWVNEGQEALAMMETEIERLTSALHAANLECADYAGTVRKLRRRLDVSRQMQKALKEVETLPARETVPDAGAWNSEMRLGLAAGRIEAAEIARRALAQPGDAA